MAQKQKSFLSSSEVSFLRELLMFSMSHYTREIDADLTLLDTCSDDMKEVYNNMLISDKQHLHDSKLIYQKLLDL